ncbi:hypothetical protein SAMN05880582_104258 [Rhizobium sp. RU20A]|uniref:AGROH133_08824 family phage infection protein n=1 Tax=Rhizobium sp. RU20A TaxID=1907412 RepID=UPI000955BFFA|nr:DUF4345 domain-containing protein [Rhizobium sp. RU20A]SIQ90869.1 hypothetical protein SAMN05880582_104258 [Rhizobium sp. RU20A]
MDFYIPSDPGELVAFTAAAIAAVLGLLGLIAPRTALRLGGLDVRPDRRDGLATARSSGGFQAGLALSAILLAQDWLYLGLGGAFLLAAFGRLLSLMSDRSTSLIGIGFLVLQLCLGAAPLLHVFGLV